MHAYFSAYTALVGVKNGIEHTINHILAIHNNCLRRKILRKKHAN